MRCTKCGIDHSAAIGCKQALTLAGNLSGGPGLPSARPPMVALTRCQACRRLHAPHCGAADVVLVPSDAKAHPVRDGMGYEWADAQVGLAVPTPAATQRKARRPRKAPPAGESAAALGDGMIQQEASQAAPTAPAEATEPATPQPERHQPRTADQEAQIARWRTLTAKACVGGDGLGQTEADELAALQADMLTLLGAPSDPVASVTESAENWSNPEKSETNGAVTEPKPRGKTNSERRAAHRERRREAIRIIDRERKRAQKGKTA